MRLRESPHYKTVSEGIPRYKTTHLLVDGPQGEEVPAVSLTDAAGLVPRVPCTAEEVAVVTQ